MKGRCWTKKEDQILAETVLRHIREGSTQLEAFEEVARKLGRTPGACGFRWNAVVRRKEEENFLKAKKQRLAKHLKNRRPDTVDSLKQLIQMLRRHEREFHALVSHVNELGKQLDEKEREYERLVEENRRLTEQLGAVDRLRELLTERYSELFQLLRSVRPSKDSEGDAVVHTISSAAESSEEKTDADTGEENRT
ncbi:MAG: RsfA family transcriptional regulator [Planifilum fimeticola]